MTPLFAVPGSESHTPPPGHQRWPGRRVRRPNSRLPADRASRKDVAGDTGQGNDSADLLAVTSQRLRRALGRSFRRYGIPGDLEGAVHAAMNVVEPVLQARDTEILRLRRLMTARIPGR
ncbi:MAG: hypothetical protein ACM3ML_19110 [Micromonosporaceae bacterium]